MVRLDLGISFLSPWFFWAFAVLTNGRTSPVFCRSIVSFFLAWLKMAISDNRVLLSFAAKMRLICFESSHLCFQVYGGTGVVDCEFNMKLSVLYRDGVFLF